MDSGDIHNLVERYFNRELSDKEIETLFSIIRQDAAAEIVYSEYLLAMEAIRQAGRSDLKSDLNKAAAKQDEIRHRKLVQILIIIAAVLASWLIFVVFIKSNRSGQSQQVLPERDSTSQSIKGTDIARKLQDSSDINPAISTPENVTIDALVLNDIPSMDHDEIYNKYYSPFRDESLEGVTRSIETADPVLIFQSFYWDKKYAEAGILFEKNLILNSNNDNLRFQYAICLLETKRYSKAEETLIGLLARNETRFEEEVPYYLTLALIKNRKIKAAKELISKSILDKNGKYYPKYIEIMDELKE